MGTHQKMMNLGRNAIHVFGADYFRKIGYEKIGSFLRLAFNDAIAYNPKTKKGGPNASIKFPKERYYAHNKALIWEIEQAMELYYFKPAHLDPFSLADFIQILGGSAVEFCRGPSVLLNMKFGRKDAEAQIQCLEEDAYPKSHSANDYLQKMSKLGFSKEEIVALCAVEAFGIINRSLSFAWEHPSQFDNTYFQLISSKDTTKKPGLKSDTLFEKNADLKILAEKFAEDQDAFYKTYESAHVKWSELGCMKEQMFNCEEYYRNIPEFKFGEKYELKM